MYFSLDNVYIFFSRRFFRKLYVYANCKTLHNADKYYNSYKKKKKLRFFGYPKGKLSQWFHLILPYYLYLFIVYPNQMTKTIAKSFYNDVFYWGSCDCSGAWQKV